LIQFAFHGGNSFSRHISLGKDSRFFNERNGGFDLSKAAVYE
jgi:hypothetical protein